ncbi:MAG: amidohydrolase family protein [Actinobacteria bacterium]|nr:amidohydrolase family protein [Actinomycetota bacterium]
MEKFDAILLKGGTLVSKDYDLVKSDVLIRDKIIVEISKEIYKKQNYKVLDAADKIVAPGFIDIHSHIDFYQPFREHRDLYEPLLFQGVTTCLGGNCGHSIFPVVKENINSFLDNSRFLLFDKIDFKWGGYKDYLAQIKNKILFNFASLTGCSTLRIDVAGFKRKLSDSDFKKMEQLLVETLESGSFGISSGLMYMPGTFSDTDELIKIAKIASRFPNVIYTSHMRGYSYNFLESIKEIIKIGRATGIKVHCSHLGPFGIQFAPKIREAINLIEGARVEGVDITYDSLSYLGGNTSIMAIFPPWAFEKGHEKFLKAIKDNEFYKKLINYIENHIPKWPPWEEDGWTDNFVLSLGWDNLIALGPKNKELVGKSIKNIAEERKISVQEALRELLLEEGPGLSVYFRGVGGALSDNDENIKYFDEMIENGLCLTASDAIFSRTGFSMPYLYGTYSRIINRYVKIKKSMSLKKVIERFTSRPAERFGFKSRGYLRKNYYADIVVFDINNYRDYPDIFAKNPKYTTGVEHVIINGKPVIEDGKNKRLIAGDIILNR